MRDPKSKKVIMAQAAKGTVEPKCATETLAEIVSDKGKKQS